MKTSPTQRTLKYYRELGFKIGIVEHWNQFAKIRQDLFGFIDLVVLADNHLYGVQTTSSANHAARVTKIFATPLARSWLNAGGEIVVMSWRKLAKSRKWEPRIEYITKESWDNAQQKTED